MSEFIQNIKQALNADSNISDAETSEINLDTSHLASATERVKSKQCNYSNDYYGDQLCIDKDKS